MIYRLKVTDIDKEIEAQAIKLSELEHEVFSSRYRFAATARTIVASSNWGEIDSQSPGIAKLIKAQDSTEESERLKTLQKLLIKMLSGVPLSPDKAGKQAFLMLQLQSGKLSNEEAAIAISTFMKEATGDKEAYEPESILSKITVTGVCSAADVAQTIDKKCQKITQKLHAISEHSPSKKSEIETLLEKVKSLQATSRDLISKTKSEANTNSALKATVEKRLMCDLITPTMERVIIETQDEKIDLHIKRYIGAEIFDMLTESLDPDTLKQFFRMPKFKRDEIELAIKQTILQKVASALGADLKISSGGSPYIIFKAKYNFETLKNERIARLAAKELCQEIKPAIQDSQRIIKETLQSFSKSQQKSIQSINTLGGLAEKIKLMRDSLPEEDLFSIKELSGKIKITFNNGTTLQVRKASYGTGFKIGKDSFTSKMSSHYSANDILDEINRKRIQDSKYSYNLKKVFTPARKLAGTNNKRRNYLKSAARKFIPFLKKR